MLCASRCRCICGFIYRLTAGFKVVSNYNVMCKYGGHCVKGHTPSQISGHWVICTMVSTTSVNICTYLKTKESVNATFFIENSKF